MIKFNYWAISLFSREHEEYALLQISPILFTREHEEYALLQISPISFTREHEEYALLQISPIHLICFSIKLL